MLPYDREAACEKCGFSAALTEFHEGLDRWDGCHPTWNEAQIRICMRAVGIDPELEQRPGQHFVLDMKMNIIEYQLAVPRPPAPHLSELPLGMGRSAARLLTHRGVTDERNRLMAEPSKSAKERWVDRVENISRIAHEPSVGQGVTINGKPVRFNRAMIVRILKIRHEGHISADNLRSTPTDQPGGGGGGGAHSPVEAAVLAGETSDADFRQPLRDPVGDLIEKFLDEVDIMERAGRRSEDFLMRILNCQFAIETEHAAGRCECCNRVVARTDKDVLHRGRYCGACNKDWSRHGRPHDAAEVRWRDERRAELEAKGEMHHDSDGPGYQPDEIDELVANGTLPNQGAAA